MPTPAETNEAPRAIEAALDQIGADAPAVDAPAPAVDAPTDAQTTDKPDAEIPAAEPAKPGAKMAALLDSLSEPEANKPVAPVEAKPVEAPAPDKPAATPIPTPEQEEAELLEGVKSPRGQERIKQVFAEKKQLETDINEFRDLVKSTGMQPQEFAQTLEFGRLVNSGSEADTRVALQMLENQRAVLYAKLGVEAPGVDLLKEHPDLQKQVGDLEISRESAVELAKHRKAESARIAIETQQRQQQQSAQEFERTVGQAAGQMEAYLETRKGEIDHPARMRVIVDHFRDPKNLQAFVQTYSPQQWGPTVRMMYDNIKLAPQTPAAQAQPLRSRPAQLGAPASSGATPIDRIASRMDAMGL